MSNYGLQHTNTERFFLFTLDYLFSLIHLGKWGLLRRTSTKRSLVEVDNTARHGSILYPRYPEVRHIILVDFDLLNKMAHPVFRKFLRYTETKIQISKMLVFKHIYKQETIKNRMISPFCVQFST
jgi:hypothetical protein